MKNIIVVCFILLSAISMSADLFYYSGGEKVPLTENHSRVAIICKKAYSLSLSNLNGLQLLNKFSDERSNTMVFEKQSSLKLLSIRNMLSSSLMPEFEHQYNVLPCYKDNTGLELTPTGYIYVELKSPADYSLLQQVASQYDCIIVRQNKFMPLWYTLYLSEESGVNPVDVSNRIYETGYFSSSSPSFSFDPWLISFDPFVDEQWGLCNNDYEGIDISASKAWNYSTGRGVIVAIIDQGIDLNHVDLAGNLMSISYDASTGLSPSGLYDSKESKSHGTHCAGIVGAIRNNNLGVVGVAPDVKLMSISIDFNKSNNIYEQLADGINWAWKNGADVLSCSWRSGQHDLIKRALDNAIINGREKKGCVVVAAGGNDGVDTITFPAKYRQEIIAVGAIENNGEVWKYSNSGPEMFVCAPGVKILSTIAGDSIDFKKGTSMACPHVSGTAALILARNPSLTADKVREIIAKNTKKIGNLSYSSNKKFGTWNKHYGYGLLDAYRAVLNTPRY